MKVSYLDARLTTGQFPTSIHDLHFTALGFTCVHPFVWLLHTAEDSSQIQEPNIGLGYRGRKCIGQVTRRASESVQAVAFGTILGVCPYEHVDKFSSDMHEGQNFPSWLLILGMESSSMCFHVPKITATASLSLGNFRLVYSFALTFTFQSLSLSEPKGTTRDVKIETSRNEFFFLDRSTTTLGGGILTDWRERNRDKEDELDDVCSVHMPSWVGTW